MGAPKIFGDFREKDSEIAEFDEFSESKSE